MRKIAYHLIIIIFLSAASIANGQTTSLEQKTDKVARLAINYMNAHQPDSVYQLAGTHFKKIISQPAWNNAYKQLTGLLPFTKIEFISSKDSINKYKLTGKITLTYYVSLDRSGKFYNFSFVPYHDDVKTMEMTEAEQKTDIVAQKVLSLINRKQADSIYLFAGDSFKKQIDAGKWKSIAENGFFPLTPLPEATFSGSKNGVNRYKMLPYQFIIGLDEQGKFNTLALQPYKEDAVKTVKALSDNNRKTGLDSAVDKIASAYIQTKGNVGLSIGVYYKGKDFFYNYGETKAGNNQLPTAHTIYDIGSITKTFTATLLAIAIEQGKITLTNAYNKISARLGSFKQTDKKHHF